MREQHLDLLPLPPRGAMGVGLGDVARHIAGALVDAARHLPGGFLGAAARLETAGVTVVLAGTWAAFTRFLADGRICLSNNAAERALRGIALGRKAWLFAGSQRGGERAAAMYTLIHTCKLNDVDPQAWLADVLARIADHRLADLAALLPWHWAQERERRSLAA